MARPRSADRARAADRAPAPAGQRRRSRRSRCCRCCSLLVPPFRRLQRRSPPSPSRSPRSRAPGRSTARSCACRRRSTSSCSGGTPTPLSPILVWRAGQLTSPAARERLAAALRRVERSADASHLAGASPLNRPALRASGDEIDAVVDCLLGAEPVRVRGVLLVRRLLDDPAGPLYGAAPVEELRATSGARWLP